MTSGTIDSGIPIPASQRMEMESLLSTLVALKGGRGRIIEIAGAPGTGKSRILAAISARAQRMGFAVLNAHYAESVGPENIPVHGGSPFSGAPVPTNGRLLHEALGALPSPAGDCRAVVLLDDFHWSGRGGADLLEQLMRRTAVVPLLLVLTHRPKQLPPALRSVLARGVEQGTVQRVDLGPLAPAESARILGMPASDARLLELHRLSQGVPLFLLALAESGPDGAVQERYAAPVLAEIARLGPDELAAARAAALLGGRSFDLESIAAVTEFGVPRTVEALDGLLQRDILRAVGIRLSYRHPLLRRLVGQETDPAWLAAGHRKAAAHLAARAASATELAAHLEHCLGDPLPGDAEILHRAASEALLTDPQSAARWARAALDITPAEDDGPRRALTTILATAVATGGRLEAGRDLLHALRSEHEALSPATIALYAQVEVLLCNHAEAGALLGAELARWEHLPEPPLETVEMIVVESLLAAIDGRPPAPGRIELALRIARSHRSELTEAGALALQGLGAALENRMDAATAALADAAALIDRFTDLDLAAHLPYLTALAWGEALACEFHSAQRHFARGTAIARKHGRRDLLPVLLLGLAVTHLQIGRPSVSRELAREAGTLAQESKARHVWGFALAVEALGAAWAEPEQDTIRLAEKAVTVLQGDRFHWALAAPLALATVARLRGDRRRAVMLIFDTGGGPALEELPSVLRPRSFQLLAGAVMESGRPFSAPADPVQTSDGWASRAEEVARVTGRASHRAHAGIARGHALRTRGELEAALDSYRTAAFLFSSVGMTREQALALMAGASCASAAGRADDAASMLQFADELAHRIDSETIVGFLQHLRAPETDSLAMAELTPREREIATMAGDGRKTRDIARQLSVSPRTVEVHLSRIYRKLNIDSRTSLALLLAGAAGQSGSPAPRAAGDEHRVGAW
ncbi:LuxR C-terminal-related transcriptional regulator [Streptomyces sp. NPDC002688]|uniref:helix-turn-helix transcriptional regulator n=1 Tax=Streptomyces sp. NPDC002688 TaxID=3154423 RepID=UPI00332C9EEC